MGEPEVFLMRTKHCWLHVEKTAFHKNGPEMTGQMTKIAKDVHAGTGVSLSWQL